jgi:HK97 family phage major capsid protein
MSIHTRLLGPYSPLERKDESIVPSGVEFKRLADDLMTTIEAFRKKNDESLADMSKRINGGDVVLKEHVDRINSAIDDVQKKMADEVLSVKRELIFTGNRERKAKPTELIAYEMKFLEYVRKGGDRTKTELDALHEKAIEAKALATTSEADGGFTVLPQMEQTLIELVLLVSPVREVADVMQIGTASLRQPVNKRGTSGGWVGETDPRLQTSTSSLAEIEWVPGELFAQPAATQQMLDDSFMNVEQWMASEVALIFAQLEGNAFIKGDGVKKPKGFLSYNVVADTSWTYGNVGYIPTGATGGFLSPAIGPPVVQGADVFFDLVAALKYPYRPNAKMAANRRVVAQMRKLKTVYADYLWAPGIQNGQADSFAGYPLVEMEDMPDIAASSLSIIFGDFKQFYRIVDRVGIRTLRDPFSSKPYVLFYTTKRVGGGIRNFEAAKILKFSIT